MNYTLKLILFVSALVMAMAFLDQILLKIYVWDKHLVRVATNSILVLFTGIYLFKIFKINFFFKMSTYNVIVLISLIIVISFGVKSKLDYYESSVVWKVLCFQISLATFEEFICRHFLLVGLAKNFSVIKSLFISSVIFGALHLVNLFYDPNLYATLSQLIYATLLGIFLGGIFIRTKNILIPILIHQLINLTYSDNYNLTKSISSEFYRMIDIPLEFIILAIIGIIIIWPIRKIKAYFN